MVTDLTDDTGADSGSLPPGRKAAHPGPQRLTAITGAELGRLLAWGPNRATRLRQRGMPKAATGYELPTVVAWLESDAYSRGLAAGMRASSRAGDDSAAAAELLAETIALRRARRERAELDLAQHRGSLIWRHEVEKLLVARILFVKQGLLMLSNRICGRLDPSWRDAVRAHIQGEVHDLLDAYSHGLAYPEQLDVLARSSTGRRESASGNGHGSLTEPQENG